MSPTPSRSDHGARREALVIAAMTAAGGLLRLWSIGHLGLVHFDEGIYAMAGTWALSRGGLAALDPTVISYAPPGFPILVGLAYSLLGVGDVPAILVSIVAGTLTIPVAGWLGYRTFGRGAGASASAFAALSGPHIAFSRMALTDASFLLTWLVAIGQGQRFVERPGPSRAVAMGLAVGVAQLFKYNGWLAGVVVAMAAAWLTATHTEERSAARQVRLWGWGIAAAMLAALVYWPWFRFVESHGGYAALLAHHRSYLGGISSWPGHALIQLAQEFALSSGRSWRALGGLSALAALLAAIGLAGDSRRSRAIRLIEAAGLAGWIAMFQGAVLGGLPALIVLAFSRPARASRSAIVLAVGWGVLASITPFYHPYARLLLPMEGLSWVLMGGALAILLRRLEVRAEATSWPLLSVSGCTLLVLCLFVEPGTRWATGSISVLLEPSDSLRRACRSIAGELPKDVKSLRLYARPPVTFYLSGVVPVAPQPTPEDLLASRDPSAWALLDSAMMGQGGSPRERLVALTQRWDLVREFPTTMNLPTLLDVDPSVPAGPPPDRSAPLLLFRPKRPGASR